MNTISAEQNTMQDQKYSTHVTEVCEYAIIFVQQFNMSIVNDAA